MRKVYFGFTVLTMIAVLAQFYLATFGAFETPHPAVGDESAMIGYHALNGTMVIPLVSLLTTIVAALARVGGRLIGLSIAPLALVVVQLFVIFPLAELAGASENETTTASLFVLGFHALDGVAILAVAVILLREARGLLRETAVLGTAPSGTSTPV
ncbi:DUF6220 domain-containing protein [Microbispora sp. NPDC049125]|uniref:DUF6220 domain-containing protein n=1 Tax=Microbispora sp. NPDC049125 TaxID=3154929 RepID=UPI003465CF66